MTRASALLLSVLTLIAGSARTATAQDADSRIHLRVGVLHDRPEATRLRDRACNPAPLLNLFGCGTGSDGTQLGAAGRFDRGIGAEVAADLRIWRFVSVEGAVSNNPGIDFTGNANFVNTGETQPVGAPVTADTVMARGVVSLGAIVPKPACLEPFAAVGIGASRNRMGGIGFTFPGLPDQPSTTTARGGRFWQQAWDVGAGVRVHVHMRAAIEVGYRYQDLGDIQTAAGAIQVVRGTRVRVIDNVAGVTARLRAHRVYAGVRVGL